MDNKRDKIKRFVILSLSWICAYTLTYILAGTNTMETSEFAYWVRFLTCFLSYFVFVALFYGAAHIFGLIIHKIKKKDEKIDS